MQILLKNRNVEFERWRVVALCVLLSASAVSSAGTATNRYVVKNSPNPASPYDSLDNAAHDIQTAIDAAVAANGDQVLVAAGVYDTGGLLGYPSNTFLTNRVAINKAITVRSIDNDPDTAIIEGAWAPVTTNGPGAVRGVYVGASASLIGFTVRNGATFAINLANDQRGGGVFCQNATAVISNCVIVGNVANTLGGGVYLGNIFDSLIVSNQSVANNGGGTSGSILNRCTLSRNWAALYGGGAASVTASNCVFTFNQARGGGAAEGGTFVNCLMYGNLATDYSGGALRNNITLYNCTLVGNRFSSASAGHGGGGIYVGNNHSAVIFNSIIYANQGSMENNIYVYGTGVLNITNSCTYPAIPSWAAGNLTNAPLFAASGSGFGLSHEAGDYHLDRTSPCIDRGVNQAWMTGTVDLNGIARIKNNLVDIGCYESFFPRGTTILIR